MENPTKNGLIKREKTISISVCSPTVRIIAFQAIDPGSTPGRRNFFPFFLLYKPGFAICHVDEFLSNKSTGRSREMKLQYVTPTSKFSFPNPTPPLPSHLISSTVPTPHYNAYQKISNITPTMSEIMDSSRAQNLHLQLQTLGPFFRITAKSLQTQVELGRAEGLIRVWLGGRILHLDSIRLKRETIGMDKSIFGIGLFLGAVAIRYGYDSGCRTAELLAINDSDLYHSKVLPFSIFFYIIIFLGN